MKESKKLMKAIRTLANYKCEKINCLDCPFFQTVNGVDICLSAKMQIIQLALLVEESEKR